MCFMVYVFLVRLTDKSESSQILHIFYKEYVRIHISGDLLMPKWKSPIFTDIRNAIGDSVVFSQWKGRPYMRSWVKPANPRTNAQKAVREHLKAVLKRWQELSADPGVVTAWNAEALPYLISGYNLFMKYGRSSQISVSPGSGSAPLDVTITYTLGKLPASKAGIIRFDGTNWTIVADKGTLSSEPDSTVTDTIDSAGTYYYFLADLDVLKEGDTAPQAYQAVNKWKEDKTNGVIVEAKVVVS